LILLLFPNPSSDQDIEDMTSENAVAKDEEPLKTRVNELEHRMSKLTGLDRRATFQRDQIRKLGDTLTSFMSQTKVPRTTLASVFPSTGQVFPGSKTQPRVWMDGSSYLYGVWVDKSGNGNNALSSLGVKTDTQQPGEAGVNTSFTFVRGGVNDSLEVVKGWPTDAYTFVHVTRYNGDARGRIWNGKSPKVNWLSGHHGKMAGRVHHNKWLIKSPSPLPKPEDWLVVVDTPDTARVNMGTVVGEAKAGSNPMGAAINAFAGKYKELSDWAVAEVIVFDGKLSADEIQSVESYLHAKYGITGFPAPAGSP
jgi:hypothetical protein